MLTKDAISHYGNQAKLAAALEITSGAISQWGEYPPRLAQLELEKMTKGKLKAEPKRPAKAA